MFERLLAPDTSAGRPGGEVRPRGLLDTLDPHLDGVEVVSFDFFDTLFVRPLCDPEDLFDLVGERTGVRNFRALRKAAQAEAFRRMPGKGRREIRLTDIYECLDAAGVDSRTLMEAEYALELELTRPNPEMIEVFEAVIARGLEVVLVSDMYLPGDFFVECLRNAGLAEVAVFSSSDCDATKRDDGALFGAVVDRLGVSAGKILHIGDNELADVVRAREKGLRAWHYLEARKPPVRQTPSPTASVATALVRTMGDQVARDSYAELGFQYGGPAAVGYLNWIVEQARRDGVEQVLFLSRDGYVLDRLAPLGETRLPASRYFLGSRVAFNMAAMTSANFASFLSFLVSGAEGLSPHELLERVGVSPPATHVMADLGLPDDLQLSRAHQEQMERFMWAFRHEILRTGRRYRTALFKYLRSMGLRHGSKVALVDIGWNGTTQEAFQRAVSGMVELDVVGYYFSLSDSDECARRRSTYRMRSMLDAVDLSAPLRRKVYDDRALVELFFSAPHHSVIGWKEVGGQLKAIEDAGRGLTSDLREDVGAIAEGVELFARSFAQLRKTLPLNGDAAELLTPLLSLIDSGAWKQKHLIGRVRNFDAWSSSRNRQTRLCEY